MQTTTAVLTAHDLAAQGFTPAEIARLQWLKECYHPFREYCQSNVEFGRLAFLKWRYVQGQVEVCQAIIDDVGDCVDTCG